MRDPLRGEVWIARLDKVRPVVVMHRDVAGRYLNRILVVPVTTTNRDIPTNVALQAGEGGLTRPSVATVDNMTLAPKAVLINPVGRLSESRMTQLCDALAIAVACSRR